MSHEEYKYKFNRLDYHFNKHVNGDEKMDTRSKRIINREKEQWEYKLVNTEELYRKVAEENIDYAINNIDCGSRIYEYEDKGEIYQNYQKGDITYSEKIFNDYVEFDKLLTTGLDVKNEIIKTCFYKTKRYSNIELITMVISIYNRCKFGEFIVDTSSSTYIAGFKLSNFTKELRDVFEELLEEYYVTPKYNRISAIKMVLVSLLNKKLKDDDSIPYELLINYTIDFINAYKKRKIYIAKRLDREIAKSNKKIRSKIKQLKYGNYFCDDPIRDMKVIFDGYNDYMDIMYEIFELDENDFEKMIKIELDIKKKGI